VLADGFARLHSCGVFKEIGEDAQDVNNFVQFAVVLTGLEYEGKRALQKVIPLRLHDVNQGDDLVAGSKRLPKKLVIFSSLNRQRSHSNYS
jgi:hypothetical protein